MNPVLEKKLEKLEIIEIEIKNLYHQFGKTEIIRGVTMQVQKGERIAIIGPNGAGKSTLFHLMSGKLTPSAGDIFIKGQSIIGKKPYHISKMGLSRSFQISQLFLQLSVFDNIRCSILGKLSKFGGWCSWFRWNDVNQQTLELLQLLHLESKRNAIAANLSYAEQRTLEIGLTIGSGADIILLDEPTAGMNQSETIRFIALIKQLTHGKTWLTIEHDMGVVFDIADKIAVLAYGELIAFDTPDAIRANPMVQKAYLGC